VSFSKGASFRDWLTNVGASTTPGEIVIQGAEHTIDSVLPKAIVDPDAPTYAAGPDFRRDLHPQYSAPSARTQSKSMYEFVS
jgi:hypothetical protein